jgi:hypothetical protein
MTKRKADRVVWCHRGFFPVHYGFCPSQAAWNREMKRLGAAGEPYPQADARASTFENKNSGDIAVIVTVNERYDKKPAVNVMALIAHEAVHVWQAVRKEMGEDNPSTEFEAYALQDIVLKLGDAYEKSHRPRWARNRRN